jgi:hypothetical protein
MKPKLLTKRDAAITTHEENVRRKLGDGLDHQVVKSLQPQLDARVGPVFVVRRAAGHPSRQLPLRRSNVPF